MLAIAMTASKDGHIVLSEKEDKSDHEVETVYITEQELKNVWIE